MLQEVIGAWRADCAGTPQDELDRRILGLTALVRGIADRGVVTTAEFAARLGVSPDEASSQLRSLAARGVELAEDGSVVGAALTTRPTPHRFRVRVKDLYPWCALDTLFLPGLLDATAEVRSTCPESGQEIRLVVAPDHVESYFPDATVLSVVIPQALGSDRKVGPASPTCSQMHFFHDRDAADRWKQGRTRIAVLSVDEGFELARACWIDPRRAAEGRRKVKCDGRIGEDRERLFVEAARELARRDVQ